MPNHEQELNAAVREVLKRSVVDPDFRQLAIKNSPAALEKVGSRDMAKGASVTFIDNYGKSHKTIVLPDPISNADSLSEEDLERVAGGEEIAPCTASNCATSGDGY
jgi:hypothetical protein